MSTLQIAVDGIYWSEATTLLRAGRRTRAIFVVSQLPDGTSQVRFGDGVNGARLPTGSQVVATLPLRRRRGEPAGGAADDDPQAAAEPRVDPQPRGGVGRRGRGAARRTCRRTRPASVLTFGRAISADDYETVAALAPGVARARAYWTWDRRAASARW